MLVEVSERVDQSLDGEFHADQLSGSLFADFTLHDVRVTDEQDREVLRADALEADYSLVTLLFGRTRIDHLGLHNAVIHVTRYPDGTYNLTELAKEEAEPGEDRRIDIYRVSVTEGELIYDDQSDDQPDPIVAREVEMTGSMPVISGEELNVRIAAVGFELEAEALPRRMPFYATGVEFTRDAESFEVSVADLAVEQDSELRGLTVDGELAAEGQEGEGSSSVERFSGRFESLTVAPRLAAAFAPVPLKSPVTLEASFGGDLDSVDIDGRARTRGSEPLDFDGSMNLDKGNYELSGQLDDFDVQAWLEIDTPASVGRGEFSLQGDGEENTLSFDGNGVRARQMEFDQLDGRAEFTGDGGDGSVDYEVSATGSGMTIVDYSAGTFDVDLEGSLVPGEEDARRSLQRLDAAGSIGVQDFGTSGIEAGRIDTEIDLSGNLSAMNGSIDTTFGGLGLGEQEFSGASVALDLSEDRGFRLAASAAHEVLPQLPLFFRTSGSYGEDFNTWRLTMLELGRPAFLWRMSEPNRVFIDDGKLTVDSLVLQSGEQSVTLDGTYDLSDPDSIQSLFEELAASELMGLLDPEQLGERLSDVLGEELPDELPGDLDSLPEDLRESVPDEVEDLVPDRLRDRLPEGLRR
ncbi:MAG: hypothetical protein ACOC9W_00470 [Persicimonas sp.]